MSENPDYNLVRQYLILSEAHQRALHNCYETAIHFHRNATDVLLSYMENRRFQETRLSQLVAASHNRNSALQAARAVPDIGSTRLTRAGRPTTPPREDPQRSTTERTISSRHRRVYYQVPSLQTMSRSSIVLPSLRSPPVIPDNTIQNVSTARPLSTETGWRLPPQPPTSRPPPPPVGAPTTPLLDSTSDAQSDDTTDTILPQGRNRSNSMMEGATTARYTRPAPPPGRPARPPRRTPARRPTTSFRLPNLVPSEHEIIETPFDSPVRIRPSVRQIRIGTEVLVYSQLNAEVQNVQFRCPIDLLEFSPDDAILRIRHCGHIFREMNLRRHFRRHPRCPICRYDIRDYIDPSQNSSTSSSIRRAREVIALVNNTLTAADQGRRMRVDISNNSTTSSDTRWLPRSSRTHGE